MPFSKSRIAVAAALLVWSGMPALAQDDANASAEEAADVKIMKQHCQDYGDMARNGPLAEKFALAGNPTVAMMTNQTMPTDDDISELQIYAAAMENCMTAQASLAAKWVPPTVTAISNYAAAQKLVFVDLLTKKITYGQANIRQLEAGRAYQAEYQTASDKFNADLEKQQAAQQPAQPQYVPPATAYTPPPPPAVIPPLPTLEMPPVIRPQVTCNTIRMGSQLQTVCR